MEGDDPLPFVGSATPASAVESTAEKMRAALGLDLDQRRALPTWTEALRRFIEQADALGVLVMTSGIVGNNTHRKLDPGEFRGFALADDLAPLVFINGANSKAAQMFTLAHELTHIWLGESALSDVEPISAPSDAIEAWCNRLAAELLVPVASLREEFRETETLSNEIKRLARLYKVSTLVVLRRVFDFGAIDRDTLATDELAEWTRARPVSHISPSDWHRSRTCALCRERIRRLKSAAPRRRSNAWKPRPVTKGPAPSIQPQENIQKFLTKYPESHPHTNVLKPLPGSR